MTFFVSTTDSGTHLWGHPLELEDEVEAALRAARTTDTAAEPADDAATRAT